MNTLIILTDFDLENPTGAGWNRVLNYINALEMPNAQIHLFSSRYDYKSINSLTYKTNVFFYTGIKIDYKATFSDFHFTRYKTFLQIVYNNFKSNLNIGITGQSLIGLRKVI